MAARLPIFKRRTKGGVYWYCYVRTSDDLRVQRALHIRDDGSKESERAATAAYWREQARATAGEPDKRRRSRPLISALAALAKAQDVAERKDPTHLKTKRGSLWLCRFFEKDRDIASITAEDLVAYAAAGKASRAAVTVLDELHVYAQACKAVGVEPAELPDVGDTQPKPQEPFTVDEVRRFMLACKPKHRLLAYELHFLGLRASETRKLSEPDWNNQRVWCEGTKTRGSKRWVYIPDEMFEHMEELRARDEWTGWPTYTNGQVFVFVVRTSKRAGIGHRSPNDCRGGLATRLTGQGVPAALRGALMGNSERMQELTYSKPQLLTEELAEAMNKQPRVKPRGSHMHQQTRVAAANTTPNSPNNPGKSPENP
jgi:integrase